MLVWQRKTPAQNNLDKIKKCMHLYCDRLNNLQIELNNISELLYVLSVTTMDVQIWINLNMGLQDFISWLNVTTRCFF